MQFLICCDKQATIVPKFAKAGALAMVDLAAHILDFPETTAPATHQDLQQACSPWSITYGCLPIALGSMVGKGKQWRILTGVSGQRRAEPPVHSWQGAYHQPVSSGNFAALQTHKVCLRKLRSACCQRSYCADKLGVLASSGLLSLGFSHTSRTALKRI